jgi:hypothetical protein
MWKKYSQAGKAIDDNMMKAHCMLGNRGYKHTLTLCNTSCFPAANAHQRYVIRQLPVLLPS